MPLLSAGAFTVQAAPGDLDTTFNGTGKVTTQLGAGGGSSFQDVAIQTDGKILAVDSAEGESDLDWALVRYLSDGSLDTSFGAGGKVLTPLGAHDDLAHAVAIQNDGKIIVGGLLTNSNFTRTGALVRYNANGAIDTTFGTDGVMTSVNFTVINAVVIQTDGKIVVAGDNATGGYGVVQRFNSDGTNDSSFGSNSNTIVSFGIGRTDFLNSVALQANGKIIVAGGSQTGNAPDFAFARLNSNGTLDTTFDTDGLLLVPVGAGDAAYAVAVQADGKIVAAGYRDDDFAVVRLKSDGTLDASFDGDGIVTTDLVGSDVGRDMLIQPNGKIIVAGSNSNVLEAHFAVVSYNSDGSLNTPFGTDGVVQIDFGSTPEFATALTLDYDGNLVVAGNSTNLLAVARLLSDTPPPPPPANTPPVAVDDTYIANGPTACPTPSFTSDTAPGVLRNDTDMEGNPLTAQLVTPPTRGTVTLNPDGSFFYVTSDCGLTGTDSFTYRASDGQDLSNEATVTIILDSGAAANEVLLNISTRLQVLTDDKVLIGGFIVSGDEPKTVILRAIGPALADFGISDALADPVLELHAADGSLIMSNDNWKMDQESEIEMTGLAPTKDLESAILATLDPGAYTAIVSGKNGGTGVGLVEVYDLDATAASELANISTRGFVETADNVMIGGFILGGETGSATVLIRAIGPTLADFGVADALADPTLELRDVQGTLISSNDNWKDSQEDEIEATGLAPQDDLESVVFETLNPGAYTAIVAGQSGGTGVGLVEVYRLP